MSRAGAGQVEAGRLEPAVPSTGRFDGRLLIALALAFAFAPTLLELATHLRLHPAARAVWVFPVLMVLLARREQATQAPAAWGLVALGALWQLVALAAEVPRLARLGLVIAVIGLCRAMGVCRWPTAAVLLFAVPLPHVVAERASPALEGFWADLAVGLVGLVGVSVERVGEKLVAGTNIFALEPADGGLALVWFALGLAYCACLARGERPGNGLVAALAGLGIGFGLQLALFVAIAGALGAGHRPETLRGLCAHATSLVLSAIGLVLIVQVARSTRSGARGIATAGPGATEGATAGATAR